MQRIIQWIHAFEPVPVAVSRREMVLSCVGAWIGLLGAYWFSHYALDGFNAWFIAPMGASAVLLFAVPSSPLAQPWSIIGGNLVSALIGVACATWIHDVGLAASVAISLAIGAMFVLRCLHPPSGAVALTAILGGPAITSMGFRFVLWPVAVNSFLLLLTALLFNVAVRRRYPHRAVVHANAHLTRDELPSTRLGFTSTDLDEALKERGELLDISKDDLEELFLQAEHHAHRRRFGNVRCKDIMSRDIVTVGPTTLCSSAWQLMIRHSVKALPVVNEREAVVGIVTMHDFFVNHNTPQNIALVAGTDARVQDIMTKPVLTAQPEQLMVDLVAAFSDGGRHHLPVLGPTKKLIGMVTQSDMVAALFHIGLKDKKSIQDPMMHRSVSLID